MIDPDGRYKIAWDLFVTLFVFYSALVLPVDIAFFDLSCEKSQARVSPASPLYAVGRILELLAGHHPASGGLFLAPLLMSRPPWPRGAAARRHAGHAAGHLPQSRRLLGALRTHSLAPARHAARRPPNKLHLSSARVVRRGSAARGCNQLAGAAQQPQPPQKEPRPSFGRALSTGSTPPPPGGGGGASTTATSSSKQQQAQQPPPARAAARAGVRPRAAEPARQVRAHHVHDRHRGEARPALQRRVHARRAAHLPHWNLPQPPGSQPAAPRTAAVAASTRPAAHALRVGGVRSEAAASSEALCCCWEWRIEEEPIEESIEKPIDACIRAWQSIIWLVGSDRGPSRDDRSSKPPRRGAALLCRAELCLPAHLSPPACLLSGCRAPAAL